MSVEKMRAAIERLEKTITLYQAYENVLQEDHCVCAGLQIRDIQACLPEMIPTGNVGLDVIFLKENGTEIRLQNVAFLPHCQSRVLSRLQQRRQLASDFWAIVERGRRVVAWMECEMQVPC